MIVYLVIAIMLYAVDRAWLDGAILRWFEEFIRHARTAAGF